MRRAALVFVAIISAIVFPTVFDFSLPGPPSIAHALPSLSGATTTDVPNGDFSGVGLGDVGTPPSNNDFETAGGQVGTPPTNNGFETGDFTGWTLTGSPTVQSGGPSGYYAQIGSGQKILSSAFTVDSKAQALTFNVAAVNTGTFQWVLNVYSGSGYGTKTTTYFTSCPTTCTNWNSYSYNAVPWEGQSIMVGIGQWIGNFAGPAYRTSARRINNRDGGRQSLAGRRRPGR